MGFLRNRVNRRFPRLGLLSDLALVGAMASRLVRRSDNPTGSRAGAASGPEAVLAAGAAFRLLRRWRRRRAASKVVAVD